MIGYKVSCWNWSKRRPKVFFGLALFILIGILIFSFSNKETLKVSPTLIAMTMSTMTAATTISQSTTLKAQQSTTQQAQQSTTTIPTTTSMPTSIPTTTSMPTPIPTTSMPTSIPTTTPMPTTTPIATTVPTPKSLDFLNPPRLTKDEKEFLLKVSKSDQGAEGVLSAVSFILQNQIKIIQTPKDCSSTNILQCGQHAVCGVGCQIHFRAFCLMMSYVMNLPLIPDNRGWPYTTKWNNVFLPFESNCPVGNNTYPWNWYSRFKYENRTTFNWTIATARENPKEPHLEYPLTEGLVADPEMVKLVEQFHPHPFEWWVGQFVKYIFKLHSNITQEIEEDKKAIGFAAPCIGFHVRRTDKKTEASHSWHEIGEYFKAAEGPKGNKTLWENQTKYDAASSEPMIFIASDDSSVLPEAQGLKNYSDWKILGFHSNVTAMWNDKKANRADTLYEIVRDLEVMSKCDYLVCGLSSNICGLVFGLLSDRYVDNYSRVISLDGKFTYGNYARHYGGTNVIPFNYTI